MAKPAKVAQPKKSGYKRPLRPQDSWAVVLKNTVIRPITRSMSNAALNELAKNGSAAADYELERRARKRAKKEAKV